MRPKKSLLLFCPDSGRGSELTFVLRCRGYRVMNCDQDVRPNDKVDGLLVVLGAEQSTSSVVSQLKELAIRPSLPILMVWEGGSGLTKAARANLARQNVPMADLITLLQAMLTRKRGPKPKSDRPELSVTAAVAARCSSVTVPLAPQFPGDRGEEHSRPQAESTTHSCQAPRSSDRNTL
jgi:hypothetical protein